jgi:F420-non-reducing hydrogenase small subunit
MTSVLFHSLSYCAGCQVAFLDLHENLLELLPKIEILQAPILIDEKTLPEVDVAFMDGAITNMEEVENVKEVREKSKIVVGLGSCATFGGIPGLASLFSSKSTRETLFKKSRTAIDKTEPTDVPQPTPRVYPLHSFIDVDYFIIGCPPTPEMIGETLTALVEGKEPKRYEKTVCADCKRVVKEESLDRLYRLNEKIPDPEICLLSQGFICRGSVTRGGCKAPCPSNGVPCLGCRGPSDKILKGRDKDPVTELVDRISRLTHIPHDEVEKQVHEIVSVPHLFYLYLMSSPEVRSRPRSTVSEYIYRLTPEERI